MGAYYNEIDPIKAQWLRNLIAKGLIAPGDVDERSIVEVRPDELAAYTQCHFFAGVGIWSDALRRAGWPDDGPVWTGSCPCQPFSDAGAGNEFADERHLWPTWFRLIRERRPSTIFGEQVASKDAETWLDHVCADLEGAGYAVGPIDTCAAGFGAPHIRQRLFFVAHPGRAGHEHGRGPGYPHGTSRATESEARERQRGGADSRDRREAGALADAEQRGREGGGQRRAESGAVQSPPDGLQGGVVDDAHGERLEGLDLCLFGRGPQSPDSETSRPGPVNGWWADAEWVWCSDGTWRPHGPQSFPLALADGIVCRVGRVRAYGDGIVGPVAEEFIRAYLDVRGAENQMRDRK